MKQEFAQLQNDVKKIRALKLFVYKNRFIFLNPNLGYGNLQRLFSGNLRGRFPEFSVAYLNTFFFLRNGILLKFS